jgi:ribonucleoside-diphosphate reductase beta chain
MTPGNARATNQDPASAIQALSRRAADWVSPRGLRQDILPWRLWEKAKQLVWDPADLDFSRDIQDFATMPDEYRYRVVGLARGFMVGEEGVTLDILPLIMATADQGRLEEVMYLTTFAFEEAKHVEFFRRWFDAVGIDLVEAERAMAERMRARGIEPPDPEQRHGIFESEVPTAMRALLWDHSPWAFLNASVTYNQFVEGCLAIAGYRTWAEAFTRLGVLPGLREGLRLVQRDESRHLAYGTYLCRRIIAEDPGLAEPAVQRLQELHDGYRAMAVGPRPLDRAPGDAAGYGRPMTTFPDYVAEQVEQRVQLLRRAVGLSSREVEEGAGAEEAEARLADILADQGAAESLSGDLNPPD